MDDYDTRLRYRFWLDGELIDERWIDCADPVSLVLGLATTMRHEGLAAQATKDGRVWVSELYDASLPEHEAYERRYGDPR